MTEQEFDQQIWRRYDTVTLDNELTAVVSNVAFNSRCVRIYVKDLPGEWFKCERIVSHTSRKGKEPSDVASIIEELHKKVLSQNEQINSLLKKNSDMADRLRNGHTEAIREILTTMSTQLNEKKSRLECVDSCLKRIEKVLDNLEKEK